MNRILITGGSGFIGSHTCLHLLSEGFDIFVIDSLVNSSEKSINQIKKFFKEDKNEAFQNLRFFKGDLKDKDFINNVF